MRALGTQICRVFWPKHSAKLSKIQFFCFSSCKSNTSHITHIAQISHISHKCLKYHIYHQTSPHITHIVHRYHHKSTNQTKSTTKLTNITKQVHKSITNHLLCSMQTDTLDVHAYRSSNRNPSHKTFPAITSI